MAQAYRKPDGVMTDNVDEYIEAWQELARPIIEATNTTLYALEPGISLTDEKEWKTVSLPLWFAKRLNRALRALEEHNAND